MKLPPGKVTVTPTLSPKSVVTEFLFSPACTGKKFLSCSLLTRLEAETISSTPRRLLPAP